MLKRDDLVRVNVGGETFIGVIYGNPVYRGENCGMVLIDVCRVIGRQEGDRIRVELIKLQSPWLIVRPWVVEKITEGDEMYINYKQLMSGIIVPKGVRLN